MRFKTRTRQLLNGKWVGEYKRGLFGGWNAADASNPNHRWPPGDVYYCDCQVSTEEAAQKALFAHLSNRWGI